jgi:acetyl-CoA C-acetyltransferase
MSEASQAALKDASAADLASAIDTVAVIRIFEDSTRAGDHPHGHNTNLPGTLARDTGLRPQRLIYETVGGQSPQAMVNELARRIHAGEIGAALLSGSEANRASKGARKHGVEINWADSDDRPVDDRGMGAMLLTRGEIKQGLIAPAFFYALFENALAHKEGRTRSQHRRAMAELFQPFTRAAAGNPYAQFPIERSVDFLSAPSKENYEFADPYMKWFIAQDAVNQGAAVILTSEAKADALGVPKAKRVYLQGSGEASDDEISVRPVLDRSWAMDVAVARALDQGGTATKDIRHFDLYSCFPIAVFSAARALGLDWKTEARPLTLTGGLPFFGGPGNNYSLHGIAEMMAQLRRDPGALGLVLANGGWMTKEAAGVYSTLAPAQFKPAEPAAKPKEKVTLCEEACEGKLETFTVVHGKTGAELGIGFVRLADGRRAMGQMRGADVAALREETSPIGRAVRVAFDGETGHIMFT